MSGCRSPLAATTSGSGYRCGRMGANARPRIPSICQKAAHHADGRSCGCTSRRAAQELGPDELVEVAVQDALDVADLQVRALVADHRVGVLDVRADLTAER